MTVPNTDQGIAFSCDARGKVTKIFRDDLAAAARIPPGSSFLHLADPASLQTASAFLQALQYHRAAFDWKFDILIQDQRIPSLFSGGPLNGGFLILACPRSSDSIASEDLTKITNEQMAAIRATAKELARANAELKRLNQEKSHALENALRVIDERKKAEAATRQAKEAAEAANRAKDQFIAVLSHELRTPLTPVLAVVTALERQESIPTAIRDDFEMIRRNVELEARLIDDLLDVARMSKGKIELRREVVDLHACLQSVLEICQTEIDSKNLELILHLQAVRHHVWGDPTRLRQVFWNLLKNAIKFTPARGRISILTRNEADRLQTEITDTGIGIGLDTIQRIFGAFEQGELTQTRRFGGLGLGLSIARAIVELHGGSLTVLSEGGGKGSEFTVELAPVDSTVEKPLPTQALRPEWVQALKILLVDDHLDTLRTLASLLRRWGFHVTTADSVHSALDRAAEGKFDLLISDLGLPDGNGIDIVRKVKMRYGLHGLALSGFGTDEDIRASRAAGFDEHLTKPVDFRTLRAAVQRITAGGKEPEVLKN